jgi:hypothetical protein
VEKVMIKNIKPKTAIDVKEDISVKISSDEEKKVEVKTTPKEIAPKEEKKVTTAPIASSKFEGGDLIPANWNVFLNEDGTIECKNSITGSSFKGTRKEFSEKLRG